MDENAWFSVGKERMRIAYFSFPTTRMEQSARKLLEELMDNGEVTPSLGLMYLPPGMAVETAESGRWFSFFVGLNLAESLEDFLTLYLRRLKQRLDYEVERREPMSHEVTKGYLDIALETN